MNPAPKPVTLRFPWPDRRLGPNSRIDRRWVTSIRQEARDCGALAVREAGLELPAEPLELRLILHPPNRRKHDMDNVLSAFKSTQDGIFAGLGLDDSLIRRVVMEKAEVEPGGCVEVSLVVWKEGRI